MQDKKPMPPHMLPYHLRPEVRAQKESEHPMPVDPLGDDYENEFYGREGMGGMRCYTGNMLPYGGNRK